MELLFDLFEPVSSISYPFQMEYFMLVIQGAI